MAAQLDREGILSQEQTAFDIAQKFGEEFTLINPNGNVGIGRQVLREFGKLTEQSAVWVKGERVWRLREENDPPGRQADS